MRRPRIRRAVTLVLLAALFYVMARAGGGWKGEKLVYNESLELTAAELNGQELTLRDLAYYVGCEEYIVEQEACAYDPDNTKRYWNLHQSGGFTDTIARDTAMSMALHDTLFYQMAQAEGVALTSEEVQYVEDSLADFWEDLTGRDGEEGLGITKEEARETIRQIACAQKYQAIYAELQGGAYEDYDYTGEEYQALLKEQDYTVYDRVWDCVDFGDVTLTHYTKKEE